MSVEVAVATTAFGNLRHTVGIGTYSVAVGIHRRLVVPQMDRQGDEGFAGKTDQPEDGAVEVLAEQGSDVKFTRYTTAGHACWDIAFNDEALCNWLLEQQLP